MWRLNTVLQHAELFIWFRTCRQNHEKHSPVWKLNCRLHTWVRTTTFLHCSFSTAGEKRLNAVSAVLQRDHNTAWLDNTHATNWDARWAKTNRLHPASPSAVSESGMQLLQMSVRLWGCVSPFCKLFVVLSFACLLSVVLLHSVSLAWEVSFVFCIVFGQQGPDWQSAAVLMVC